MRIGKLEIGRWKYSKSVPRFIWFEYINSSCKCKILTICDIVFTWTGKECWEADKQMANKLKKDK